MPGTSDQWTALDRHNERLVEAGSPLMPAVQPDGSQSRQAGQDGTDGQDGPAGADPLRGQDAGLAAGQDACQQTGRHRMRARGVAAASAC